jgi:PAS domain S-box-containing protein
MIAKPSTPASGNATTVLGSREPLGAKRRELEQLIDAIPALVWAAHPDGFTDFLNKRWLEYTGMSEGQATGWGWTAAIHVDDRERLVGYWRTALTSGAPSETEARLRRADREHRWFLFRCEPVRGVSGEIVRWLGVNTDIDDRKRAEQALRNRELELQLLVDTIPSLVWSIAADGEPEYINKRMEDYYGRKVDRSETINGSKLRRALDTLLHPDDLQSTYATLMRSLQTGEPFSTRYRNRRFDGAYRWVDARAMPLRDDDGRIVKWYGVTVDIDDQKRAEDEFRAMQAQLAHANRIATMGQLSASIAHELNQPLAAVIANGNACQRWLSADPPNLQRAQTTLERIIRDAMDAADIVSRTRALFKPAPSVRAPIDLNHVIAEVRELMTGEMTAQGVSFESELDPQLPSVSADRVQIQQVLVNLLRNGMDAMRSNGEERKLLFVGTRRGENGTILTEVRDNGSGLSAPNRIFEPFFTTKEEGMGMGLPICRSIVESHGGELQAWGASPRGTVFSFTLPIQAGDL